MTPPPHKPLPYRLRAEMYAQLAQMEIAGLPFDKAFALLEVAAPGKTRLEATKKLVARGIDPAKAGERSGLFTKLEARLIRAALTAGSPGATYRRLADFCTQRAMQLATMKSRLAMPVLVLVLALLIQPLPAMIGGTIGAGGYLLQILRPVLVLGAFFYGGRWLWNYFLDRSANSPAPPALLRVPLLGPLTLRRNLRDFFESLAMMLDAGVPILDALPAALETVQIGALRHEFSAIAPAIEKGASFASALAEMPSLSAEDSGARLIEFVRTGEASGTLPEMLLRHAAIETESINEMVKQLADWTPRLLYALIAAWMAYGLLSGGGFTPKVPKDL